MKLTCRITVTLAPLLFSCYLWEGAYCSTSPVPLRKTSETISVSNGGRWGKWGRAEFCSKGAYAIGFKLKVQSYYYKDRTTLNAIRLSCSDGHHITSTEGKSGDWTFFKFCSGKHLLKEFKLRVSKPKMFGDDTAANNIVFRCTNGIVLHGDGYNWGQEGRWSQSCRKGICGLQTKVHQPESLDRLDTTGLNDVRFFCCED
ncbi:vitelline membrane outer layer protein 1-like [Anolis carolinensis]|uniref:vitelline membrane outer layer protein 1-like n=1 Tax=Anolis carolinensis TaxID=28377 RepID=UPI002F2B387A